MLRQRLSRTLLFVSAVSLTVSPFSAQSVLAQLRVGTGVEGDAYYGYGRQGNNLLADVIASRIRAQADLVLAQSGALVNVETARRIHEEAISRSLDNYVKRVDAYWDARNRTESEKLKRLFKRYDPAKNRNWLAWDRYKNLPEMNYAVIPSGRGLNFLLLRLSGTVLAYEFSNAPGADSKALYAELHLPKSVLDNINLRRRAGNGKGIVFRASKGVALNVDWWPWALRKQIFDSSRKKFEQTRNIVIAESHKSNGKAAIGSKAINALDKAVLELRTNFDTYYTRQRRFANGTRSWSTYYTAKLFLKSLIGEVARLRKTGDSRAFTGEYRFQGDNVIQLLTYMSRNGLDFAPATPGGEFAYHDLFKMMRDIYVTVADQDSSLGKGPPTSIEAPRVRPK